MESEDSSLASSLIDELRELLAAQNGFFAFESALHVFPSHGSSASYGLLEWNAVDLWKTNHGGVADDILCFAEDIFGNQFGLRGDRVVSFDLETGAVMDFSASIEDWARRILDDYDHLTGYTMVHEWQVVHGPLSSRHRLCPNVPFVLGGNYGISNMKAVEAAALMRILSGYAQALRDVPNGTKIRLIVDQPTSI